MCVRCFKIGKYGWRLDGAAEIINIHVCVMAGNFQNNPSVSIPNSPPPPTVLTFIGNVLIFF